MLDESLAMDVPTGLRSASASSDSESAPGQGLPAHDGRPSTRTSGWYTPRGPRPVRQSATYDFSVVCGPAVHVDDGEPCQPCQHLTSAAGWMDVSEGGVHIDSAVRRARWGGVGVGRSLCASVSKDAYLGEVREECCCVLSLPLSVVQVPTLCLGGGAVRESTRAPLTQV
jgi:hypothetical protein